MGFKKMAPAKYPPRQWSLVGYPGSGKSTFAAQLKTPMVVVDADHRFQEVLHVASGEVFELSERRTDNVDPNEITRRLGLPASEIAFVGDRLETDIRMANSAGTGCPAPACPVGMNPGLAYAPGLSRTAATTAGSV